MPGLAPGTQVCLECAGHAPPRCVGGPSDPASRSAICAASLSPRPDSVTSTVDPDGDGATGFAREPTDRVRRLQRRDDALRHRQQLESGDGFVVGREHVLGASVGVQRGVLGADAGIVEPGADRVRLADLALFVLEEERARAVEDAGHAAAH